MRAYVHARGIFLFSSNDYPKHDHVNNLHEPDSNHRPSSGHIVERQRKEKVASKKKAYPKHKV